MTQDAEFGIVEARMRLPAHVAGFERRVSYAAISRFAPWTFMRMPFSLNFHVSQHDA